MNDGRRSPRNLIHTSNTRAAQQREKTGWTSQPKKGASTIALSRKVRRSEDPTQATRVTSPNRADPRSLDTQNEEADANDPGYTSKTSTRVQTTALRPRQPTRHNTTPTASQEVHQTASQLVANETEHGPWDPGRSQHDLDRTPRGAGGSDA